ncbi:MAG: hypothetical protein R3C14_11190 [Caldilineaceae bacterium]
MQQVRADARAWAVLGRNWYIALRAHADLVVAGMLLLLLSGCEGQGFAPISPEMIAQSTPTAAATSTIDLAAASTNRLLVIGEDGNLFTIRPDGSAPFTLTTDANVGRAYLQATWSSTGERIAWTVIERASDGLHSALLTARADGSDLTRIETSFPPFYLYWSPDDTKVAYLSNWLGKRGQTIALRIVNVAGGGADVTTIGWGQPFYFAWSPTGEQLITHAANRRVALVTLATGEMTVLTDSSANFAVPQWNAAANKLVYVTNSAGAPRLVLTDVEGENEQLVANVKQDNTVSFGLNSTGAKLAFIETSALIGFNSFGPLFLYDLEQDEYEQLATEPVVAFFWSPDGQSLLFLTAEAEPRHPWLRINIWDGATVRQYNRFIPSGTFLRDYLRFADQYMQSMRFWAPDSSAFVYAGQSEDGAMGVWVQALDDDSPHRVAEGVLATWSPR